MEILGWLLIGVAPGLALLLGAIMVCFANIGGSAKRSDYVFGYSCIALGMFFAYHWWLIKPFTMSINPS